MHTVRKEVQAHKDKANRTKPYSKEVKAFVVKYAQDALEHGETLGKIATDFDIAANTLQSWLERAASNEATPEEDEIPIEEGNLVPMEVSDDANNGNALTRSSPRPVARGRQDGVPENAYCKLLVEDNRIAVLNLTVSDVARILQDLMV